MALTQLRGVSSLNLQGCSSLTDTGLAAIAHMTSLTCVNLQDCRDISGAGGPATCNCASLGGTHLGVVSLTLLNSDSWLPTNYFRGAQDY